MSKEKLAIKLAIDIMERNVNKYINHGIYEVSDTDGAVHVEFAEAINILNEMLEQQPCPYWDYGSNTCRHANIGALATVTPIRPKGEWLPTHEYLAAEGGSIDYVKCSCCERWSLEQDVLDFCPYCGADMRGEKA